MGKKKNQFRPNSVAGWKNNYYQSIKHEKRLFKSGLRIFIRPKLRPVGPKYVYLGHFYGPGGATHTMVYDPLALWEKINITNRFRMKNGYSKVVSEFSSDQNSDL